MRKLLLLILVAVGLVAVTACGGGKKTRVEVYTIDVDGRTDQFVAAFIAYFPNKVQAHPGDEIDFNSIYNGEPHTVTLGTDVDAVFNLIAEACPNGGLADPACAEGPPEQYADRYNAADAKLPQFLPEGPGDVIQAAGAPCYLTSGSAPADGSACTADQQQQVDFDGTQTYYNSGFLPEGAVFKVKLSTDIEPGTYNYYCLLHREGMAGTITVVDKDTNVPSPSEAAQEGEAAFNDMVTKLKPAYDSLSSLTADAAQAGAFSEEVQEGSVNEFGPKQLSIAVGDSVTWTVLGPHTISFNAPEEAKDGILAKGDDGLYHASEAAMAPAGGPGAPEPDPSADPSVPIVIDAGEWDGQGELSSGFILSFGEPTYQYKVTFTTAGTYNYVCLIHPGMLGSVTVE